MTKGGESLNSKLKEREAPKIFFVRVHSKDLLKTKRTYH
jgi:hypothetical protein